MGKGRAGLCNGKRNKRKTRRAIPISWQSYLPVLYILQQSHEQTAVTGARGDGCRAGGPYPQRRADAHLLSEWPTCLLNAVTEKNTFP